jgi:hypothetical protein
MNRTPYRGGTASDPGAPAHDDDGIVDELIHQFADPLAFYRELIQNSVDAGATSIAITASFEPSMARVSVRDDGCGMDRAILEEQLTVLFRSTKDKDDTKIGKFGIGFVSVLAIDPKLVAVRTSVGKGEEWTLHLARDQSYELFRAEGGGSAGTTVTLHIPMEEAAFSAFVENSERALTKWCRHIQIPVRLVASVLGAPAPMREVRIDRPFGLDAIAVVDATGNGGRTRVVAGLPIDGQAYLAFFNRGLLLHETSHETFGKVAAKVLDPGLEHTLSRDNVRRDDHYERAMRFARHVIDDVLTERAVALMREVAEGKVSAPKIDVLHEAIMLAGLEVSDADMRFPILGGGSVSARALKKEKRVWAALERDPIVDALGDAVVLDLHAAERPEVYLAVLSSYAGRAIAIAKDELTLVSAIDPSASDLVLLERVGAVLDHLGPAPIDLRFVTLAGAAAGALTISGAGRPPCVLEPQHISRDPFALLGRPPLWLNAGSPLVAAARERAARDLDLAAAILARAILVDRHAIDEAKDDQWLEHAMAKVGA